MSISLDLIDGAAWAGEEAQKELKEIKDVLADWLEFAKDVSPSDFAGEEWLENLRNRTQLIL